MDNTKPRDDGRRKMPKSLCPYCNTRVLDSRNPALKNSIELTTAQNMDADYYIQCPKCRKAVGITIKDWHSTASPSAAPA